VKEPKLKKPKTLEELAPLDREVCQVLASLGAVFNTAQLIKHEFSASSLKGYIGSSLLPSSLHCVCILLSALLLHTYVFADPHYYLLMSSYLVVGMVLNKEKRARLADALTRRQRALSVAGASAPSAPIDSAHAAPSPAPSAPIAAVPQAAVRASPTPATLEKDKGVLEIASDKDSVEGPVFKRQRAVVAMTS